MKHGFLGICIAIALLSIGSPVMAATVDLTPITNYGFDILSQALISVATVAVGAVGAFLARKFKIDGDNNAKAELENTLEKGIRMAVNYAKTKVSDKSNIKVDNAFVATAVGYLVTKIPGVLKKLGITPDGLAQRIEARAENILKL